MTTQTESLVYVCTTSLAELKAQVAGLEDADPRTIDSRLRQLESTATTLSSALSRLARHMDSLPADDPNVAQKGPQPPEDDGGLLLRAALRLGENMRGAGLDLNSDDKSTPEMRGSLRAEEESAERG